MVPVCVYAAGRAVKQKTDAVKTASVFLYAGKASPAGEAVSGNPGTGNRGELAPHPALRATFPLRGRHF